MNKYIKIAVLSLGILASHVTIAMGAERAEREAKWTPIVFDHAPHPLVVTNLKDFQKEKLQWVARAPLYQYLRSGNLKTVALPCLEQMSAQLTEPFLTRVKEALESVNHGRLPNAAKYMLQFHLFVPGLDEYIIDLSSSSCFISGGRYFSEEASKFVNSNKLRMAIHNFLTPEQVQELERQDSDKRGIYLGKIMEEALRSEVIGGAWKDNALDSEALILLYIVRSLDKALQYIYKDAMARLTNKFQDQYEGYKPNVKSIVINRMVLAIGSYYKPCHLCRDLIQGFQFRFRELVQIQASRLNLPFRIEEKFGSLALTFGQVLTRNASCSDVEDKSPFLENSLPQIHMGFHQYVECKSDKIKDGCEEKASSAVPIQPKQPDETVVEQEPKSRQPKKTDSWAVVKSKKTRK